MGAFLRRHAGVIQSALYVIILLLLIVFFCAPVYEVACIFTGLVVCCFRAWLSFYSCREEAREEGRTFLGWREPVFWDGNFQNMDCFYVFWGLAPGVLPLFCPGWGQKAAVG